MSIQQPLQSRYELLHKIASGGMGTVYLGRLRGAQGFSRIVAIKRAHPHLLDDEQTRKMFLEEAEISSRIRSPHVVSVQDVEEVTGEIFLVMEYVDGGPLSSLIREKKLLPLPIALRILFDVCEGLHAAHTQVDVHGQPLGIIHRDISPHNILVGATDGRARITDFGIAKIAKPGSQLTHSGIIRGKVGYLAPEYARGEKASRKSDIFALGVVAWETLVGRRLFQGATELDTMHRIANEDAPPPSLFDDALSPFDAALAKALARSPAERFESAEELALALEEAAPSRRAEHRAVAEHVEAALGVALSSRRKEIAALATAEIDVGGARTATQSFRGVPNDDTTTAVAAKPDTRPVTQVMPLASIAKPPLVVRDAAPPRMPPRRWPLAVAALVIFAIAGIVTGGVAYEKRASRSPDAALSSAPIASDSSPALSTNDLPDPESPIGSSSAAPVASTTSRGRGTRARPLSSHPASAGSHLPANPY